jgi:NADH dehydrogenase (ubiquinone) flavoprotein 2
MVQINDDFYEDLTPESIVTLLKALKSTAETIGTGEAGTGAITGLDKKVQNGVPVPGPMTGRKTCENSAGLTNLTSTPWGTEAFRKDL